jgi:hypothetical protein
VVALVDDDMTVVLDDRVDLASARQRLHDRNVDPSSRPRLAAADDADHVPVDPEESLQPLLPLSHELCAMHQYQRAHSAPGDDGRRRHRLAESRRRAQHAHVMGEHRTDSGFLVFAENALELDADRRAEVSLILGAYFDPVLLQEVQRRLVTSARQGPVRPRFDRDADSARWPSFLASAVDLPSAEARVSRRSK